ncbi:MAG: hypothetical protein U0350_08100 [Caldilineaceae bacterium]
MPKNSANAAGYPSPCLKAGAFRPFSVNMQAYRLETVVPANGELQLKLLPFSPGEAVEIIVLSLDKSEPQKEHFPLANSVLKYEDPFEAVAEDDWNVLR